MFPYGVYHSNFLWSVPLGCFPMDSTTRISYGVSHLNVFLWSLPLEFPMESPTRIFPYEVSHSDVSLWSLPLRCFPMESTTWIFHKAFKFFKHLDFSQGTWILHKAFGFSPRHSDFFIRHSDFSSHSDFLRHSDFHKAFRFLSQGTQIIY